MNTNQNQNQNELINYSLDSIAGYNEEKQEAIKIINLFKNYDKIKEFGVTIPRGLLLSGHAGVGKTLMAKVISSEANVPLFELNCATDSENEDFQSKIQEVYKSARENSPSIVFIDEINEIVINNEFVSDFSRSSLKTLLQEIDGLRTSENVLTIATTNSFRNLPPQLTRSGRFDKHIEFDLPDLESREAILKLYMKNNKLLNDININILSKKTSGFSCADLKTLINETLLEYINSNKKEILDKDFYNQIPLISLKGIAKNKGKKPEDEVIYHELGHFICEYKLNGNVSRISTERVGRVRGYIMPYRMSEETCKSESYTSCLNNSIVAIGGYAADEIFMKEHFTGALDDINKFSNFIEMMAYSGMLGTEYIFTNKMSFIDEDEFAIEGQRKSMEGLKTKYFDLCLEKAKEIINENIDLINFLFKEIKERIKLEPEEVEELIKEFNSK